MRVLLAANADVNARRKDGATALMMASQGGNLEMVRTLLAAKADVNAKTTNGNTALSFASRRGKQDVREALRDAGAFAAGTDVSSPKNSVSSGLDPSCRFIKVGQKTYLRCPQGGIVLP